MGHGIAKAVPDQCTISMSLRVMRDSVADAIGDVGLLADVAITAMHEAGVADTDVTTQTVHVQDWIDHQQQRVTARVATYGLAVTARNLAEVSSLVSRLVDAAGDALQIHAIGFSHSDETALLAAARRAAVDDARMRADELAHAAGARLGEILAIDEGSGVATGWTARALSGGARDPMAMPMQPGSENVTARVTVTYALA